MRRLVCTVLLPGVATIGYEVTLLPDEMVTPASLAATVSRLQEQLTSEGGEVHRMTWRVRTDRRGAPNTFPELPLTDTY